MKTVRIGLFGNFGAGNLGNECTLQTIIQQIRQRRAGVEVVCFCTDPVDVQRRHGVEAVCSEVRKPGRVPGPPAVAPDGGEPAQHAETAAPRSRSSRLWRIVFRRIPFELTHWVRMWLAVRRTEMLVVAGTGIVADYMCGPFGWPYDIFKLATLSALCRVKFVFLSVGVGPIRHPVSRWLIRMSLRLSGYRSYRDEASRQYVRRIGFNTARDVVCPDVVFGFSERQLLAGPGDGSRNMIVGVGLKDYGATERLGPGAYQEYLQTMAAFVRQVQERGHAVRLLIGDFQYDSRAIDDLVEILTGRRDCTGAAQLIVEPALTVEELLRQIGQTDAVVSARYHNLVMALIQNKPVIALSDHAKLDSLLTELDLAHYRLPLEGLRTDLLMCRFEQLLGNADELRKQIRAGVAKFQLAVAEQYELVLPQSVSATGLARAVD